MVSLQSLYDVRWPSVFRVLPNASYEYETARAAIMACSDRMVCLIVNTGTQLCLSGGTSVPSFHMKLLK